MWFLLTKTCCFDMIKSNQSIYYGGDAIVHISICEDEMVYQTAITRHYTLDERQRAHGY